MVRSPGCGRRCLAVEGGRCCDAGSMGACRKGDQMAINIRNRKVEALARRLAKTTGESENDAILHAPEDRRCAAMPDLDTRAADEIPGCPQDGRVR